MREIKLDELKKIQVEILENVNDFCQKNNIKYWLDCGTLLGAVRHKGYIPWDDDIDIGMLREDYDKFMKLFNKNNTRYKFYSIENNEDFYFQFGKVLDMNTLLYEPDETGVKLNVYIDVFVYDNAPFDDKICDKMFKKRDLYRKMRYAKFYPKAYDHTSFKKRIMRFFLNIYLKFVPKNYYVKKLINNSKRYANEDTGGVGNFTSKTKFICDKSIFQDFVDVSFEGKKYPAPVGYDKWLKSFYGDYMKLPPKEKRVSNHVFKAYMKDEEK